MFYFKIPEEIRFRVDSLKAAEQFADVYIASQFGRASEQAHYSQLR